ncbi:hypothetical protein AQUCO_02500285v1 [Aquilegia coerulea]|uniref:Glycine-rich protein n=1 Tax=Aquilegia coerulea TaxID=218851 RepID=A0A2G5DAF5_AQUCA|nr:hypothetical protein AQUCO_02500285v1 [Aquilegia coerulea]
MASKTSFIVLGLVLTVVLLISSSEVAAKDLETANGVEDAAKYDDNNVGLNGNHGGGHHGGGKCRHGICCGRHGHCGCC